MKSEYIGRIKNAGAQLVKAVVAKPTPKAPKVKEGGDLRAKPSKK